MDNEMLRKGTSVACSISYNPLRPSPTADGAVHEVEAEALQQRLRQLPRGSNTTTNYDNSNSSSSSSSTTTTNNKNDNCYYHITGAQKCT